MKPQWGRSRFTEGKWRWLLLFPFSQKTIKTAVFASRADVKPPWWRPLGLIHDSQLVRTACSHWGAPAHFSRFRCLWPNEFPQFENDIQAFLVNRWENGPALTKHSGAINFSKDRNYLRVAFVTSHYEWSLMNQSIFLRNVVLHGRKSALSAPPTHACMQDCSMYSSSDI